MRILTLSADYPRFLHDLYASRPGLAEKSYADQLEARNASLFGVADFYSRNFRAHGHAAAEIHLNNFELQHAWAREHGLPADAPDGPAETSSPPAPARSGGALREAVKPILGPLVRPILHRWRNRKRPAAGPPPWVTEILRAQIEDFRPDVILNQEIAYLRSPILKRLKSPGLRIVGQIASPLPEDENFRVYDLVISSLPNQVEWFRKRGAHAELNRLAFEPSVLDLLGPQPERDIPLSFVGSLSPAHSRRIAFLEYLATRTPLQIWGTRIEDLAPDSPLHACYRGEAWGREMYDIMHRSRITLNFHLDVADGWANNLRLYEATGTGALLLTDAKRNLRDMFAPGEEVAGYADAQDCVRQIDLFLADDPLRARIAAAGQRRTLTEHTFFRRTAEIAELIAALR